MSAFRVEPRRTTSRVVGCAMGANSGRSRRLAKICDRPVGRHPTCRCYPTSEHTMRNTTRQTFLFTIALASIVAACGNDTESLSPGEAEPRVAGRRLRMRQRSGTPAVRVRMEDGWTNTEGVDSWVFDCSVERAEIPESSSGSVQLHHRGALRTRGDPSSQPRLGWSTSAQAARLHSALWFWRRLPAELTVEWTFGGPLVRARSSGHRGDPRVRLRGVDRDRGRRQL